MRPIAALLGLFVFAAGAKAVNVDKGGFFPYFADGAGWTTTFHFVCLNQAGCIADVSVRGSDGRNLPIRLKVTSSDSGNDVQQDVAGSKFNLQIYNGSSVVMETLGTAPSLTTGGMDVVANGLMAGHAVLRQRVEGRADYEATVPMEPRVFYDMGAVTFDNRAGGSTGVALANLGSSASAEILVRGFDLGANPLFSSTITLEALNNTTFDVARQFPEARGKAGVIRFIARGGAIGGMAFRFNATGPFTTVPFFSTSSIQPQ